MQNAPVSLDALPLSLTSGARGPDNEKTVGVHSMHANR